MNKYLIDTNVVSEAARPLPRPEVVARLESVSGAAIAAVTWHELSWGVLRMPRGRRRDSLDEYVQELSVRFPILAYDKRAADWHATQRARLDGVGRTMAYVDGQIAAIAATRGLTLVTRNLRDFDGYTGLDVESWWDGGS